MSTYWCEHAALPSGVAAGVRLDLDGDRISAVTRGAPRAGTVLGGLVYPGFANAHSHAFHRALRGRTHHERGSFWTWRNRMYTLAGRLDPDSYHRLAMGVYAEMVLAGYTSVAEFHYLHHAPGGARYRDPNAMGHALAAAAAAAGIRLTLLHTCYLSSGFGEPPSEPQRRFADTGVAEWAARIAAFRPVGDTVTGAAVHSVRAVAPPALAEIAAHTDGIPLHVHLSEQRAENDQCLRHYGATPTEVLAEAGILSERTVAVHATHLTGADIGLLADTGTGACFCPTTERDLGDGIGPAPELREAGVPLSLGSDSHAMIDPFEEARALELDERLRAEERGRFPAGELLAAATAHHALGRPDVGELRAGAPADLVVVDLDSVRTAGVEPGGALFAAAPADVRSVMVGGRWIVQDRVHQLIERPETVLGKEIEELWRAS